MAQIERSPETVKHLSRHLQTLRINKTISYLEQTVNVIVTVLEKLKTFSVRYKFQGKFEEIDFFRKSSRAWLLSTKSPNRMKGAFGILFLYELGMAS